MTVNVKSTIYERLPVVAALNKIQGFDPRKFLRQTVSERTGKEVLYLDLKYKKLWFRLACPKGRIKTTALKITDQIAIIEAKIFFDKNDKEPAASFISQRNKKDMPGLLYVEAAQYAAVNQALIDAGFGLQFCDVSHELDTELLDEGLPFSDIEQLDEAAAMTTQVQKDPTKEVSLQTVTQTEQLNSMQTDSLMVQKKQEPIQNQTTDAILERAATEEEQFSVTAHVEAVQEERTTELHVQQTVSTQQEPAATETVQAQIEIAGENVPDTLSYTADMAVEEICRLMTLEEAGSYIVEIGTCKGWTLQQVAQRRAASLKWYLNGYTGDNNILRAAAKLLLEREKAEKTG
jgi:hypothetical protein